MAGRTTDMNVISGQAGLFGMRGSGYKVDGVFFTPAYDVNGVVSYAFVFRTGVLEFAKMIGRAQPLSIKPIAVEKFFVEQIDTGVEALKLMKLNGPFIATATLSGIGQHKLDFGWKASPEFSEAADRDQFEIDPIWVDSTDSEAPAALATQILDIIWQGFGCAQFQSTKKSD
jgi:hypothetical protein